MFYEYKGIKPVVHESAYVHPQATVTGQVIIGKNVYVGPGAAIRGDFGTLFTENLVHGSDSTESAARELGIFFPAL